MTLADEQFYSVKPAWIACFHTVPQAWKPSKNHILNKREALCTASLLLPDRFANPTQNSACRATRGASPSAVLSMGVKVLHASLNH